MTGISICCDTCGIQMEAVKPTKAEAVEAAKKAGWTLRTIGKKQYFFCPPHAEAEPDQKVIREVMDRYGYEITKALNA